MKILSKGFGVLALAFVLLGGVISYTGVSAACNSVSECVNGGVNAADPGGAKKDVSDVIKTVINIILYILTAVSVIMIVIGGVKYTMSQGDSSALTSAKNTILYSVIGLIIAIAAYAIVNFVVKQFV